MASSCLTLQSTFAASSTVLNQSRASQSHIQARAIPALAFHRQWSQPQAARSFPPKSGFASMRRLLGATAVPSAVQVHAPQKRGATAKGGALAAEAAYPAIFGLAPDTLQWVFTVASTALMFRLLPPVSHALLVPALFLNLPGRVVEAMKAEGGAWVAVAVIVLRLFTSLPSYVDLPLAVLLSILVAPYELLRFRGTQAAGIVTLAIGIFIAYNHVTANNGIDNTMRSDVLPTTFGIALVLLIPVAFLLGSYGYA